MALSGMTVKLNAVEKVRVKSCIGMFQCLNLWFYHLITSKTAIATHNTTSSVEIQ